MTRKLSLIKIDLEVTGDKAGIFTRVHNELEMNTSDHVELQHHLSKVSEILSRVVKDQDQETREISLEEILLRR